MKAGKVIAGIGILGGIAALVYGIRIQKEADALKQMDYAFEGMTFRHFTLTSLDVDLRYRIINPGTVPLRINGLYLEIFRGLTQLAVIRQPLSMVVPAGESVIVTMPAVINNASILQLISKIITDKLSPAAYDRKAFDLKIFGYANYQSNSLGIEYRYPINMLDNLVNYLPQLEKFVLPKPNAGLQVQ